MKQTGNYRTADGDSIKDLKMYLEVVDKARVTDHGTIKVDGFTYLQLMKTLKALKRITARAWHAEAERVGCSYETQTIL